MLKKEIATLLLITTVGTAILPPLEVSANPGISYADVEQVSLELGPAGPIIFFLGLLALEGFEVYDALKVNNFGAIECRRVPFLPEEGAPNSVVEKIDPDTGEVMQRRYYDENGKAFLDVDYGDHGYPDAHPWKMHDKRIGHKHTFDWTKQGKSKRSKGSELTFYEYVKYVQLPEAFRN